MPARPVRSDPEYRPAVEGAGAPVDPPITPDPSDS